MTNILSIVQVVAQWASMRVRATRDETGATAVEYGVMVGLIAAVIIGAVTLLGSQLNTAFCSVVDALNVPFGGGSCE